MSAVEKTISIRDIKETILSLKKIAEENSDENEKIMANLEKLHAQRIDLKIEVETLNKRSGLLEEEYNVSNENLELIQMQIDNFNKLADENERWRKEYEKKQCDCDEREDEMNAILKSANASSESASIKHDEALDKLKQTNDTIAQLQKKITATKNLVHKREKEVKEKATIYKQLQCKSEERIEKSSKKEEYINFLRKQVAEAELRALKAEADVSQKKTEIEELQNRLKMENDNIGTLKKDMNSIYSEFKKL